MGKLCLSEDQRALAIEILSRHLCATDATVYAFGSRANGHSRPFSDLDLAIECKNRLPRSLIFALEEDFAASVFPFQVDVVDLGGCEPDFRQIIEAEKILLTQFRGIGNSAEANGAHS